MTVAAAMAVTTAATTSRHVGEQLLGQGPKGQRREPFEHQGKKCDSRNGTKIRVARVYLSRLQL